MIFSGNNRPRNSFACRKRADWIAADPCACPVASYPNGLVFPVFVADTDEGFLALGWCGTFAKAPQSFWKREAPCESGVLYF